jgi:hypothetical protein
MASAKPSYMLPPNFDFTSDGAIALGKVIKEPKRPDRALHSAVVDQSLITKTKRSPWSFSINDARSGSVGLFATFLAPIPGIGADIAGSLSLDHDHVYRCEELVTQYFVPDDIFIAKCLCSSTVKAYTKAHRWRSIYMITGIKIAHGATMETTAEEGHSIGGKVGVDSTPSGVPIGGGPEAKYEQKKTRTVKFGSGEDFILAYQLLKIKPKRDDLFKEVDYNKFALLGDDEKKMDDVERNEAAQHLHEAWDIEEVIRPIDEADWAGVELSTLDDLDFNVLGTKPPSD